MLVNLNYNLLTLKIIQEFQLRKHLKMDFSYKLINNNNKSCVF